MADVVITLLLERKSGILAAAISALTRGGLQFQTHNFDSDGNGAAPRLNLVADSDGEFGDPRALIDDLGRIRGVDSVVDVQVDGRSLLNEADRGADAGADREAGTDVEAGAAPKPDPEPEPESAPEPEADEKKAVPKRTRDSSRSARSGDDSDGPDMRPSMLRRRRRRR